MAEPVIKQIENFLSFCAERHKVISKNIANIGTENYKREELTFSNALNNQLSAGLKVSSEKHITKGKSAANTDRVYEMNTSNEADALSGVNNVDIEEEMALLAENTLLHKFASRKVGSYYRSLQNVIKGGQK